MRICWMCKKHQPVTSHTDIEPKDGDISLCISCGEWNRFEDDRLIQPDEEDYEFIHNDPLCRQVRNAWVEMRKRQRAH